MSSAHAFFATTSPLWAGSDAVLTGLARLDEALEGGLRAGTLWVIAGHPGAGRSVLAAELARAAATSGAAARLVAVCEEPQVVAARLLSAAARVPLHRIRTGRTTLDENRRVAAAREALSATPLRLEVPRGSTDVATLDEVLADPAPFRVLLVDDADLWWPAGRELEALRRLQVHARSTGATVVLTKTTAHVLRGGAVEAWGRLPDVHVDLHRPELFTMGDRPGQVELKVSPRPGAPAVSVMCGFQGHFARVVDLGPGQAPSAAADPTAPRRARDEPGRR